MVLLRLLGGAALLDEHGQVSGRAVQRRRLALLALLAVVRKPLSRDRVTAYFWPESDTEQARHLLSVAIYELRKALHEDALISTRDEVALNTTRISSDVAEFESALARSDYAAAVAAYGGPFLDGFNINDAPDFERWADGERDRLARAYAGALEQLAEQHARNGDADAAIAVLRRLSAHDPYSGRIACMLMVALENAGDRAAALQHARAHAALLREEFGADPDAEVEALAERLRRDPREASAPPAAAHTAFARKEPRQSKRSVILAAAVTAVITVVALFALVFWRTRSVPTAQADAGPVRTIAVLPFRDLTGDAQNGIFIDGLSEEIINTLSSVPALQVVQHTSTLSFRGELDMREVGEQLGVAHVLWGTVRMAADRLSVTARLIDADTRSIVWAGSFDHPLDMKNVLAIQDTIANAVVTSLAAKLNASVSIAAAEERSPSDVEAFNLYVRGRHYFHRRTVPDLQRGLQYFQQAIARDPEYALAHAGIAETLALLGAFDYGALAPAQAFPAARAAAERALALDPDLPEGHTALASVLLNYDRDWQAAEREYKLAIERNHGYASAYHWYSLLLHARGRREEAFRVIMRSRELDPLSSVTATGLARHYYFARQFDRAVAEYQRALAMDSSFVTARIGLGVTHVVAGQYDAALAQFETAIRLLGMTPPILHGLLAHTLGRAGRHEQALGHLRALEAMSQRAYVPAEYLAISYIGLGDHDRAFAALNEAIDRRSNGVIYLPIDPVVDPIRSDPRFEGLLARISARNP